MRLIYFVIMDVAWEVHKGSLLFYITINQIQDKESRSSPEEPSCSELLGFQTLVAALPVSLRPSGIYDHQREEQRWVLRVSEPPRDPGEARVSGRLLFKIMCITYTGIHTRWCVPGAESHTPHAD